jgi:hypothetical protein
MSREGVVVPFKDMWKGRFDSAPTCRHCLIPVGPRDADAAAEGVLQAYRAAGLPRPEIVWCDDPLKLSRAWASAAGHDHAGVNAREIVYDRPCQAAVQRLTALPHGVTWRVKDERHRVIRAAIQSAVTEYIGDLGPSLFAAIRCPLRRSRVGSPWAQFAFKDTVVHGGSITQASRGSCRYARIWAPAAGGNVTRGLPAVVSDPLRGRSSRAVPGTGRATRKRVTGPPRSPAGSGPSTGSVSPSP